MPVGPCDSLLSGGKHQECGFGEEEVEDENPNRYADDGACGARPDTRGAATGMHSEMAGDKGDDSTEKWRLNHTDEEVAEEKAVQCALVEKGRWNAELGIGDEHCPTEAEDERKRAQHRHDDDRRD